MAKNDFPPVMKAESYPLGHAKENKDASTYTGFKFPAGGGNDIGSYKQPMPNPTNAMRDLEARANRSKADTVDMSVGNISRSAGNEPVKTSGIKMRGTGAATKGVMSRGPMA